MLLKQNIPALETQLQALNNPFGCTFVLFDIAGRQYSLLPVSVSQVRDFPAQIPRSLKIFNVINLISKCKNYSE